MTDEQRLRESLEDLVGASQVCLDWLIDLTAGQFDARYGAHYSRSSVFDGLRKAMEKARAELEPAEPLPSAEDGA